MVNVPFSVFGMPSYMYCMLLPRVVARVACKSILKLSKGSSVALICKSSEALVVAGVATESLRNSHPRSLARSTYESPVSPKAKSSAGAKAPVPRVCPKASPTFGMNPGSDMEYWLW